MNIQTLIDNKDSIYTAITSLISFCAVVATLTPSDSDNKVVAQIQAVVHLLGMNFGLAKNESKKDSGKAE